MNKNASIMIFGGLLIILSFTLSLFETPYTETAVARIKNSTYHDGVCITSYEFEVEGETYTGKNEEDSSCSEVHTVSILYQKSNPENNVVTVSEFAFSPYIGIARLASFSIGVGFIGYGVFLYLKSRRKPKPEKQKEIPTTESSLSEIDITEVKLPEPKPELEEVTPVIENTDKQIFKSSLPKILVEDESPITEEDRSLMFQAGFKPRKRVRKRSSFLNNQ